MYLQLLPTSITVYLSSAKSLNGYDNRKCWVKKESTLAAEKFEACSAEETNDIDMACIQGVLSTLDPEIIGKLAQCASEVSISNMQACVEEQLFN